jgi:hypothetical protein
MLLCFLYIIKNIMIKYLKLNLSGNIVECLTCTLVDKKQVPIICHKPPPKVGA